MANRRFENGLLRFLTSENIFNFFLNILDNGTLRLRPVGASGWDVWTPYEDNERYYYSQPKSKAKSTPERAKRPANPFFKAFRR